MRPRESLGATLELGDGPAGGARRVMLTGALPGGGMAGFRRWIAASGAWVPEGPQYVTADQPRLRYRPAAGGARVDVYRAAPWFGEAATAADCSEAWALLGRRLATDQRSPLLATPGTTGRTLLWNMWADRGVTFPTIEPAVQHLIRGTSGQGRFELFPAAAEAGEGLWRYDGRFMYAALAAQELPTGAVEHDEGGLPLEPFTRCRLRVTFTAPRRWSHVGLVGVPHGRSWTWPTAGEHETWVDGAELHMLAMFGWRARIHERIWWPAKATARPLGPWVKYLGDQRAAAERWPVMASAWRAIVLHTIGALHGRPHRVVKSAAIEDLEGGLPPAEAVQGGAELEGGRWWWTELAPPAWPEMSHPEWSAHLWARARVRLYNDPRHQGLANVPRTDLVACALDAIYTRCQQRGFTDDGRTGTFRPAGRWGAFAPLHSMADLYAATAAADPLEEDL